MPEELEPQIRQMLQAVDSADVSYELPMPSQVWSRLQFRIAHRPRREAYALHAGTILVVVYVLAFLMWSAWSTKLNLSLIAVLTLAVTAAGLLYRHVSRTFRC